MTDEYTQPDCPDPADETYRHDEATPKDWPNALEAALLALAVLFFGIWVYAHFLTSPALQTGWGRRYYEALPIALLLVLFLWMQRRFRFDLLGRFSAWTAVFVVVALALPAFQIHQLSRHHAPIRSTMLWAILWVGVAAPIVEELFFRGVLLKALARHVDSGWAIIISTLAFAFAHPPVADFYVDELIKLILLGLLLGMLTVRTRSIVPAIVGHIAWNLVFMWGFFGTGLDVTTTSALGVAVILGISVTIGLISYIYRRQLHEC